mmetsp:Transcript_3863/g.24504  ORF Transcript_3863/g.24504 Transcript_3863/m.24504 type:complete len:357 (-) Transcript_3863:21-1091(-)
MGGLNASNVGLGVGLAAAAGTCTVIGAILVFFVNLANRKFLAGALGFSSGVMLYLSFVELLADESVEEFEEGGASSTAAFVFATLCFFGGAALTLVIDKVVHFLMLDKRDLPEVIADHDAELDTQSWKEASRCSQSGRKGVVTGCPPELDDRAADGFVEEILNPPIEEQDTESAVPEHDVERLAYLYKQEEKMRKQHAAEEAYKPLRRTGFVTAIAIGLHNFPEGIAVFFSTVADRRVGGALAVAIAIHNIPEGIAIALPVYYASKSKLQAFLWCLWAGLAEPLGALLGWVILAVSDESPLTLGIMFGLVAGIMVYIGIQELFVTALAFDPKNKLTGYLFFFGMAIMALSLILFKI